MKQLFLSFFLLNVFVASAQNSQKAVKGPAIKFQEDTYNFGNLKEGVTARHVFRFKNTGKAPLIIQNAVDNCACATHEWTKDPVMPGKTGEIIIVYQTAGRLGQFSKEVYVRSNVAGQEFVLRYKGYVLSGDN